MKKFIEDLRADKIIWKGSIFSLLVTLASFIYLLLIYNLLPPVIPIFNQLPWGIDRLGAKIAIFIPPIFTLFIFLINIVFAKLIYENMPLISRLLTVTTIIVTIITSIFIIKITVLFL